jgi:protein O-mannosyl-transferase
MEGIRRRPLTLLIVFIFVLIALTYGNTLHAPFNFDDSMVIKTEIAQDGEKYFQPFPPKYRHLFYLSFALNYAQGKLDPFSYHLLNISLHFFTTLVVFFISYITLQRGTDWGTHAATTIATITTIFFAISPVHTETVTYISGRSSGLSGFFYFSTLLLFMLANFREKSVTPRAFCYLFSVVFFFAAVLSKEISLTFPALILLYDFCFMKGEQWSSRKSRCLYFYLPVGVLGALALFQVGFMKALVLEWAYKIDPNYALQQSRIIGHAIYLLLFPIGLTLDYDFPDTFFPSAALSAWPLLLMALLVIGVAKYFPKALKISLFGALWFLFTIAPTNSFLPRLDLLSERNLYVPSFGIFLLMAAFIYSISQGERFRKIGLAISVVILAFQVTLSIERNTTYRSNIVLWEDTVKKAPGKTRAWQNLSHYYLMELNYAKAFDSIQGLIRSNPTDHYLSQAHSKLGIIHRRQGNNSSAIASYEEAIRLDPSTGVNYLNLGGLYIKQGKFPEAITAYENAERLFKNSSPTIPSKLYLNKAFLLFQLGLYKEAETAARTYLNRGPKTSYAHTLLGNILLTLGKQPEAEREYAKASQFSNPK